jgi:hypothetical protein
VQVSKAAGDIQAGNGHIYWDVEGGDEADGDAFKAPLKVTFRSEAVREHEGCKCCRGDGGGRDDVGHAAKAAPLKATLLSSLAYPCLPICREWVGPNTCNYG